MARRRRSRDGHDAGSTGPGPVLPARVLRGRAALARVLPAAAALAACCVLIVACAQMEAPPGGPVDDVPPRLVAASPDSGATGVDTLTVLRFTFSEKMEKADAIRWLSLFPSVPVRKTRWHGLREAEVHLAAPLPADTVVVVEVLSGLRDAHGVPGRGGRRYPISTGGALPTGEITGDLVKDDKPLAGGVVLLRSAAADTLEWSQRPVLRRAVADTLGRYRFTWLNAGGPYLVQALHDANANLRADEGEAQRLVPDTALVVGDGARVDLGRTIVYAPSTPGRLVGRLGPRPARPGAVFAFTQKIAENDTGWTPAPQPRGTVNTAVPDTAAAIIPEAGPGLTRAIFFVDASGDSVLSAIPAAAADSAGAWVLEPWALVDSLLVEPGLDAPFPAPVWPDTLTAWVPPGPAAPDSAAAPDSTRVVAPDTLRTAPPDTGGTGG